MSSWTLIFRALRDHISSAYTGSEEEIRIPDTIVFNGFSPIHWFYSPPRGFGVFSHSEISPQAIFRTFTKDVSTEIVATVTWFEKSNPLPFIGYLNENDLRDLLLKDNDALPKEWILQKFIGPDSSERCLSCYLIMCFFCL